jgi:dienelactone hydrolase
MRLWDECAEAIANAGAYYVSVSRPNFNTPQIEHWVEDVMAAYQLMRQNENVDTNRVFLCGASEETQFVARPLNEEPGLWKGAMLNSPTAFPDLGRTGVARILINCGEADEYHTFETIKKFQADAARAGIPVTIAAHNTGHVFISAEASQESTQQFVEFLFESSI